MDYNSIRNQQIKEQFVNREVLACQSMLVDKLIEEGIDGFSYDDIQNMYLDYSEEIGDLESEIQFEQSLAEPDDKKIDDLMYKISELADEQENPQEIYEWWLITDWFKDKLLQHGEPILDNDYGTWWGRTCTGQAILLDGVISSICKEMEILEGQSHEWKR
jgi:hypothetical protein